MQLINTVSIHTSTQGSVGSKISLHKAKLLAALTMEVGDLNRAQNNGVNALFSATNGDNANEKFVGSGNNQTAQTGQIISFAAETSGDTFGT